MTTTSTGSFEAVLQDFKTSLNTKQIQNFEFTTLDDVRQTAIRIQSEQDRTKSLMNMTRLMSFLEAMEQFGNVIGVFVNASSFLPFVWGPMKFLLLTASTWADSFEILLDAYSQLGEHIPLLQQYHSLFGSTSELITVLLMIYEDILSFHKEATKFFSGTVWRQLFRSRWKDFEPTFKQILDNLNRHRNLIREQAIVVSFQRKELFIEQHKRDVEGRSRSLKERQKAEQWRKYLDVVEWFSAANSIEADHANYQEARRLGTGDWILKNEEVRNWLESDVPESSILWIKGIPGAGKTILASIIIDASIANYADSTTYFYCKKNDAEKNTCISIYRGILRQLLTRHRDLVPYCWDEMVSTGETILTTTHLAEGLLKTMFAKTESFRLIIDGLNECDWDQRKLLLAFFTSIVELCDERQPGKLRIIFLSQDYIDIQKAMQIATTLQITEEDNKADIGTYVREWTSLIQQKYDLDPTTALAIEDSTCGRARGMFLFAKLVMEHYYGLDSKENLLQEIKSYGFPGGLEEAYELTIKHLRNTLLAAEWENTLRLMGYLVCAKRPLRWREIQAAVSMNAEIQAFDFEKPEFCISIQDYCGPLFHILPGDRVELVHTTAKMHIASSEYISKSIVECQLASICLRYLTFDIFAPSVEEESLRRSIRNGALSFQDYAVAKWMEHLHTIITNKSCIPRKNEDDTSKALDEFEIAVNEFALRYEKDILECEMTDRAEQDCEPFRMIPYYENLMNIWNMACQYARKGSSVKDSISIRELSTAVTRSRDILEKITAETGPDSPENAQLNIFYGDRRFKCPKVTCYYFHEGFKDAKTRDQHINRHDRPFSCSFPDCSIVEFGFSSNRDLERHRRFFHPETEEQANSFRIIPKTTNATPFECNICRKRFTRSFIHKQHLLSHTGTRPHACSECGKAFTRANDCKRHEKIHLRRRLIEDKPTDGVIKKPHVPPPPTSVGSSTNSKGRSTTTAETVATSLDIGGDREGEKENVADIRVENNTRWENTLDKFDPPSPESELMNPTIEEDEFKASSRIPIRIQEILRTGSQRELCDLLDSSFDSMSTGHFAWLKDLDGAGYTRAEIADLLWQERNDSPWIYFDPSITTKLEPIPDWHVLNCSHLTPRADGDPMILDHHTADEVLEPGERSMPESSEIQQLVAELCGIGGVAPVSRDQVRWAGFVHFKGKNNVSTITYGMSELHQDLLSRSYIIALFGRAYESLERFGNAFGRSQRAGICCNTFTILRRCSTTTSGLVEMIKVELDLPSKLLEAFRECTRSAKPDFQKPASVAAQILRSMGLAPKQDGPPHRAKQYEFLHLCSLAVQALNLGFLSYCQGHTGSIRPFFLDTPQEQITLCGANMDVDDTFSIVARLHSLSCLNTMTQDRVLVFEADYEGLGVKTADEKKYDVLASPEDLMDTWGPGQYIAGGSVTNRFHINALIIGGGTIDRSTVESNMFHWHSGQPRWEYSDEDFSMSTRIRIGSKKQVSINLSCSRDEAQCWLKSADYLDLLGPYDSAWEAMQRQVGLQGGQFLNVQAVQIYGKLPGHTLKQANLCLPTSQLLPFLESPWGLQVSFCTGIAKRVTLCEMIADLMPAFVESLLPVPDLWLDLRDKHNIVDAFRSGGIQNWLGARPEQSRNFVLRVIDMILSVMKHTGIDRAGKYFVIGWIKKCQPFQCFKVPCHREAAATYWAQILADSRECATFAYITPRCLQNGSVTCRGPSSSWENASTLLETAVCRYQPTLVAASTQPWELRHSDLYSIGKFDTPLTVKVHRPSTSDETRLQVCWSLIPTRFIFRLSPRGGPKTLQRLRERQSASSPAENVLVSARD